MKKITDYVTRLQLYRNIKFTEIEVMELLNYLKAYPEWAAISGLDHYITSRDFFTLNNLLVTIRDIMEQEDPNLNPAQQWSLVRRHLLSDDFGSQKVIFENIRTNIAIELMGGQGYLCDVFTDDRELLLRKEFIENYHRAVIIPSLNWRNWIVYNPDRYTSFSKDTVNIKGYSSNCEITENDCDLIFRSAINNRHELLTGQNILAIESA